MELDSCGVNLGMQPRSSGGKGGGVPFLGGGRICFSRVDHSFHSSQIEHLYGLTVFENYLYATNSDNANAQQKTSVIRVNRFNSTDYQVVTRVDKGGALHIYHQRRQPQGEQGPAALPGALLQEPQVLSHLDSFSRPSTPDSACSGPLAFLPAPPCRSASSPSPREPFPRLLRTQSAGPSQSSGWSRGEAPGHG